MPLPDNIRHLIEALRGGGYSHYKDGKLVEHRYGPPPKKKPDTPPPPRGRLLNVAERNALKDT